MKTIGRPAFLISFALGLVGCATDSAPPPAAPQTQTSQTQTWGYSGAGSPEHWGEIAPACKDTDAAHESPIDITTANLIAGSSAQAVQLDYRAAQFELENNGHAIEAVAADPSANAVSIDGTRYALQQFHFHTGSEHLIDGRGAAGELHLVHKAAGGRTAVLGLFLKSGDTNAALEEVFAKAPGQFSATPLALQSAIDPKLLVPSGSTSFRYDGSLTTPPCTEGVVWTVYQEPISVSPEQLKRLQAAFPDNRRPVQPLHGRQVARIPAA